MYHARGLRRRRTISYRPSVAGLRDAQNVSSVVANDGEVLRALIKLPTENECTYPRSYNPT